MSRGSGGRPRGGGGRPGGDDGSAGGGGGSAGGGSAGGAEPAEEDLLPAELDVTRYRPYHLPNIRRRRVAAVLYWICGGACAVGGLVSGNAGLTVGGVALGALGAYSWTSGWDLRVDQLDALVAASRAVGFPVGHASAQLAWRGMRSRPTWRVLLFSADEPASRRGLVEVDGVDGTLLSSFSEENPDLPVE